MTGEVVFHCPKDPHIEQYCQGEFGPRFTQQLRALRDPYQSLDLLGEWQVRLYQEAQRQQWYDFSVTPDGVRRVLKSATGQKVLLVPTVTVTEGVS